MGDLLRLERLVGQLWQDSMRIGDLDAAERLARVGRMLRAAGVVLEHDRMIG